MVTPSMSNVVTNSGPAIPPQIRSIFVFIGRVLLSLERTASLCKGVGNSSSLMAFHRASFLILMFPHRVQLLSVHRLTPTHKTAETVLQLVALALCHIQKDDLIVVASVVQDSWPNGLKTLTAGMTFPMLTTLLQPERLHGNADLFLNFLSRTFMITQDRLLRDEEYALNSWLLTRRG